MRKEISLSLRLAIPGRKVSPARAETLLPTRPAGQAPASPSLTPFNPRAPLQRTPRATRSDPVLFLFFIFHLGLVSFGFGLIQNSRAQQAQVVGQQQRHSTWRWLMD